MEISRARVRAELRMDDWKAVGKYLEAGTGERVTELEPVAEHTETIPEVIPEDAANTTTELIEGDVHRVPQPKDMEVDLEL